MSLEFFLKTLQTHLPALGDERMSPGFVWCFPNCKMSCKLNHQTISLRCFPALTSGYYRALALCSHIGKTRWLYWKLAPQNTNLIYWCDSKGWPVKGSIMKGTKCITFLWLSQDAEGQWLVLPVVPQGRYNGCSLRTTKGERSPSRVETNENTFWSWKGRQPNPGMLLVGKDPLKLGRWGGDHLGTQKATNA